MKKTIKAGLAMTFAALFLMGCTSEEVTNPSQVEYRQDEFQDVNIRFFDATLEQMGAPQTRGGDTSLSQNFKRLDVALFSDDDATMKYTATQSSDDTSFGTVTMRVPTGKYTLVGVAHKGLTETTKSATLESLEKVTFPNNLVGDVAYVKQAVTVNTINSVAATCSLKRAVSLFRIHCSDDIPGEAKSIIIKFDKNCNFFFNPTTGFSTSSGGTQFEYTVNKTTDEVKTNRQFDVYLFLADETILTNVTVTTVGEGNKVLNAMTFENVQLQVNYVTTYTGKFFTAGEDMAFSFTQGDFKQSTDYDLSF